jgi:hypothetical protein
MDYRRIQREEREIERPHPIWRGIGCILILIIPVLSFALAMVLLPVIMSLPGFEGLPPELRETVLEIENFWAVVGLAVMLTFALYAVLAIINAFIYSITGSSNLRRFESEPQRYKRKKQLKKR